MASGAGIFFDGKTSAQHQVTVSADPDALRIRSDDGMLLAQWRYDELRAQSAPDDLLRVGRADSLDLARLEIRNPALASAIDELAHKIDRTGKAERRTRHKVIAWTFAATVSLVFVGVVGIPALVERLAPLVPWSVEQRLGLAVDSQVRGMLDTGKRGGQPFECGGAGSEQAGRAALEKLMRMLEGAAALPIPLKTVVIRRSEGNAVALPGGHVYVFEGLISKAETPDELAAVISHEIGHVAHRDGTRSLLQAAGLSFLFGMVLGDFTGGGVVVIAARSIMESAYSREVEALADLYAVSLMARIGGEPRALGTLLVRLDGSLEPGIKILRDHPITSERVAAINKATPQVETRPLLDPAEWAALKAICG